MGALLPVMGKLDVPAGATGGDTILTHINVVRGSVRVAGGSYPGKVAPDGSLTTITGQRLTVPVVFGLERTDAHPMLRVDVSWRGQGVGFAFYVDLLLPAGRGEIDINEPVGGGVPVVPAEQANDLTAMLARGDQLLSSLEGAARRAATAADFAYGAANGHIFATMAELETYHPVDGTWASVALHTFFRRELGDWVPRPLGRLPAQLGAVQPRLSVLWTPETSGGIQGTTDGVASCKFLVYEPLCFDTLALPASAAGQWEVISERGEVLAAGAPRARLMQPGVYLALGRPLTFWPGQHFFIRVVGTATVPVLYAGPGSSTDGAVGHEPGALLHPLAVNFVLGETVEADVVGHLDPRAFPVAEAETDVPNGGVARVNNRLVYRDASGVITPLVDSSGYDSAHRLPLSALEEGEALGGLGARVAALEGRSTGLDLEAVQDAVAAMFGTAGVYDDAAGTYTLNLSPGRSQEEIEDMVAALIRPGSGVSATYDDAAGTLTLTATGGGGGGATTVITDGSTITGDGSAGNPLVAHGSGLPAGGNVGQVLTNTGPGVGGWADAPAGNGSDPSAGEYSSTNRVPLATLGTPNFLPSDRVENNSGNYRMVGPVFTGARTYLRIRVPLRPSAVQAGSPHVGVTAVLYQINLANNLIVRRLTQVVAVGQAELLYAGPFAVPASETHAFVVGVVEGNSYSDHLDLFLGSGTPYSAPYTAQPVVAADTVPSAPEGGTYGVGAPGTSRHRTVLMEGSNIAKGTIGPALTAGATADRPSAPTAGDQHYDTTLHKPVWYDGGWRDATGALV